MKKHAFTLIELLVVIAIIAILAAILFPVFARAREAARKTTCLSNVKQLALAHLMYTEDYDERLATSWSYGFPGEFTWAVEPYIKNLAILHCPDRTTSTTTWGTDCNSNILPGHIDNPTGEGTVWAYGFNTGCHWNDQTGLTDSTAQTTAGQTVTLMVNGIACVVGLRTNPLVGKSLAAVQSPAECILLGDTADMVVAGLGQTDLDDYVKLGYDPGTCGRMGRENWPRHNGQNNAAFVDGHAKSYMYDNSNEAYTDHGSTGTTSKVLPNVCWYFADYNGSNVDNCMLTGDGVLNIP